MPKFHYIALDQNGQEVAGELDASSEAEAINLLRQSQLYPTQVAQEGKGDAAVKKRAKTTAAPKGKGKAVKAGANAKIKAKVLMIFTRQLATLIDSGLPLLRGLTVLARQEPNPVMKSTVSTIAENVQTGSTFSETLSQYPKIFNKLYINMVKAGELGGVLEVVLNRLAEYQEKAQKLKNKVVAAMVYPIIVMIIAVVIMVFLMLVIVPRFEKIFEDMLGSADKLPQLTKIVIGFSRWMGDNFPYLVAGVVVITVAWKLYAATVGGRRVIDGLKLKIPLFGDVQRKTAISRFSRTLGTLVTSGVPILQALNITRETAGNVVVSDAITKVHDAVKEGESMVAPLESSNVFPPMVISMVDVGEETGQLPEMLLKIADVYEDEVDNAVSALTSMLEPLMIVMLAVVVGVIVMALFLPLIEVIKGLSGGA
ncbi:type II secretion system F family protein [Prosthecobacter dejongeii]|uniref:Type IV pilus assembly protein PilC n=1 Tax=Prosthecobacter dejongeii TaxID=48465 RepID=A0A7W7YGX1_9BACT|nr:type II secretion system F family protein [Prosthecobacter dejongeii]MBB5035909.1 type IV pilus assembly protein PilC [Prosthecobacter dejongeii]